MPTLKLRGREESLYLGQPACLILPNLTSVRKYLPLKRCTFKLFKWGKFKVSCGSRNSVEESKKHEIYAATFGNHLFYLFLQQRGHGPPSPMGSATESVVPWNVLDLRSDHFHDLHLSIKGGYLDCCANTHEYTETCIEELLFFTEENSSRHDVMQIFLAESRMWW